MTHFVSFRLLAGIFRRVYRNCFLRALRIVLTEEKLFRSKKCFKWVSELERKRFRFSAKKLARIPNFCSISPEEHFFKKNNDRKKKHSLVFFRLWAINAGTLLKNLWLRSLNWKIHIQGIKFYHISWCSMTHFVSFRVLAGIFGEFIETAFFDRWGSFWQKRSSFVQRSVFLTIFGVRAKKF